MHPKIVKFEAMKALISGASRGIGRAIAEELASKGYQLILISRGSVELEKLTSELSQKYPQTKFDSINADLSNKSERTRIIEQINKEKVINVLVNNLGAYSTNYGSQTDYENLMQLLETNLFSAIELTQAMLPALSQSDHASIINIGSVMSHTAEKFASDYAISKHALKAWNDALREELREKHIKVSAIYPGAVNTSSWDDVETNHQAMIQTTDIAKLISTVLEMGNSTLVEEIRLSPLSFDFK